MVEGWLSNSNNPTVLVFDDLVTSLANDKRLTQLVIQGSHHCDLSVVILTQNLFAHGKEWRTISLNCQMMVLFKSPRDQSQVMSMSRQMFPHNPNVLIEAYRMATERPHGYLVINLKPNAVDQCRLMTNIIDEEGPAVVFVPK